MENSSSTLSMSLSTSNGHHNLNNLPDLVYYHILKNLDLDDLLSSKLISKKFYSIVKDFHIYELSFLRLDYCDCSFYNHTWLSTTKSARLEYQLSLSKLSILNNPFINLSNLRYLRIQDYDDLLSIKLDDLNKFTKLQILHIGYVPLNSSYLHLPDLTALHIKFKDGTSEIGSLMIDTPKLHSLSFNNVGYDTNLIDKVVKFNNPLSIKYLGIFYYEKNASIFTNLECLEVYGFKINLEPADLLKLKSLKKLRITDCCFTSVDELVNLFKSKNDLEFSIDGVTIKEIKKIEEFCKKKSTLEFQLNNYHDLEDDLSFFWLMSYDNLVRLLPGKQLTDLFAKYSRILILEVESRIEDDSQLIHFIRGCSNLESLSTNRSSLSQQFYDQLPAISSLSYLEIMAEENLNLNFNFIKKMYHLINLQTDQTVIISKKWNLNNFKRFKRLTITVDNAKFMIFKYDEDDYVITEMDMFFSGRIHVTHKVLIEWSNLVRNKRDTRSSAKRRKLYSSLLSTQDF